MHPTIVDLGSGNDTSESEEETTEYPIEVTVPKKSPSQAILKTSILPNLEPASDNVWTTSSTRDPSPHSYT